MSSSLNVYIWPSNSPKMGVWPKVSSSPSNWPKVGVCPKASSGPKESSRLKMGVWPKVSSRPRPKSV